VRYGRIRDCLFLAKSYGRLTHPTSLVRYGGIRDCLFLAKSYGRLTHPTSRLLDRLHILDFRWIPAYAGMTGL